MQVLNPDLYVTLKRRFGEVRVSNEGSRHVTMWQTIPYSTEKRELTVDPGEYYRVCCPYCNDNRFRLYVNHRWNTIGSDGRRFGKHLAVCFNEKCDLSKLEDELKIYVSCRVDVKRPPSTPIRVPVDAFTEVNLPGLCRPLSALHNAHGAKEYIRNRQFDWQELEQLWGVQYCESTLEDADGLIPGTKWHAHLVRNRLIMPIYWQSKLVGWQARAIDETSMPKYYTMPGLNKNNMLFNADRAKLYKFGVVVEGVFDAFRVGARAVALLGKSMSTLQRTYALSYWQQGALCLLLDADAIEDMENLQKLFNSSNFRWGAFSVVLPEGQDPGNTDRDSLWSLIAAYARNRGISLTDL